MAGGLISIVSYGSGDLYLTGAPQITFFKILYRRYTNFSKESIYVDIGNLYFDNEITINIPKVGDLISTTYLQIVVPQVLFTKISTLTDIPADYTEPSVTTSSTPTFLLNDTSADEALNAAIASWESSTEYLNYLTVSAYITATNIVVYRAAKQYYAQNITPQIYVEKLLFIAAPAYATSSTVPETSEVYDDILSTDLTIFTDLWASTHPVGYTDTTYISTYSTLTHSASNFVNILINYYNSPSPIQWTMSDVYDSLTRAISYSQKVHDYYYNQSIVVQASYIDIYSPYSKFAWVEKLGHAMIDRIDCLIGGERMDRHHGDWLEIWHELTSSDGMTSCYKKMIGDMISMTSYNRTAKPQCTVTIPLLFWFCQNVGLAFPLIALQYSNMSLVIKLKRFNQVAYIENVPQLTGLNNYNGIDYSISLQDVWDNNGLILTGGLLIDYVYLDAHERKRFAQSAHEYLTQTVQTQTITDIGVGDAQQSVSLGFSGPVKEFMWFARRNDYVLGTGYHKCNWFNYGLNSDGSGNPTYSANLTFNGLDRFDMTRVMSTTYIDGFNSISPPPTQTMGINQYGFNNAWKPMYPQNSDVTTTNDITTSIYYTSPAMSYFNYLQPYAYHHRTPVDGINVYSFSLFPEEHQPSCVCNFSRIASAMLNITLNPAIFTYALQTIMKDPFIYYNEESSPIPQIITGNTIYTANTPANITLSTPFITYANEGMTDTSADLDVRAMGEYIQRYGMTGTVDLNFYAVGYNILRIIGGMAAYAYY